MTEIEDISIVKEINKGNVDAFAYIVRRYQTMIYSIVYKVTNNTAESQDITQEVFIKIFQSLSQFKSEAKFSTWVYRIAYNTTISLLRQKKHQFYDIKDVSEDLPDEDVSDAIDRIAKQERMQCLDMVIAKLSPDDAILITLFYMEEKSIQEVAEISNLSLANVKVRLHRIRKFMNFEINKLINQ